MTAQALFIGRFQPFHLGHLDAIKQILNEVKTVVIAIGSAQYSNTKDNPLSYQERKKIITKVLWAENIKNFVIYPVTDIDNDEKWVDHVENIVGKFDVVYTGNAWTKRLFEAAGVRVRRQKFVVPISGTVERSMISNDDLRWRNYLHPEAITLLERVEAIQRISDL
jgi:nicotinamide-nucleotide adenylyltransferase